jgi:alkylation response protein AidB-like acyl-CoA dehydrogenase
MLDARDVPWDGSRGLKLIASWQGHGMIATQSHAMNFCGFPAMRCAWSGQRKMLSATVAPFIGCLFAAVITGIIDAAMELAQTQLGPRRRSLRAFEQVELARAELDAWLIGQAFEGMLRAAEAEPAREREVSQGKLAIAELAEQCTQRLCRVLGGGTFACSSAIGNLFEDVRALGFLRPPWGLAYQALLGSDP